MHRSQPIAIDGRFLGVAVAEAAAWRFIATDPLVEDIDGATFPDVAEATRVARLVLRRESRVGPVRQRPVLRVVPT